MASFGKFSIMCNSLFVFFMEVFYQLTALRFVVAAGPAVIVLLAINKGSL
jgi:hypothetical protein